MELRQKAGLELRQSAVMCPRMLESLEILLLPLPELRLRLEREMLSNPALEEGRPEEPAEAPRREESEEEFEYPGQWYDYFRTLTGREEREGGVGGGLLDSVPGEGQTLREYLASQLHISAPVNIPLGEFIIGNIDADGYLRMDIPEIASARGVSVEEAESMLALIQSFDPPGACARDLGECLLLQATAARERNSTAEAIIRDYLPELRKKQLGRIASGMGAPAADVAGAVRFIAKLNPRPGASFASGACPAIFPDVIIHKTPDGYAVTVSGDEFPELRISRFYRKLMKNSPVDVRRFIGQKIKSAEWLLSAVAGRKNSLRRISECIIDAQLEFLEGGSPGPSPLRMKDAAALTGLSESTVSRAVSGKYVETGRGIFPMKYFFSGRAASGSGGEVSSAQAKERIVELVKNESPDKPLSDGEIASALGREGISIARRTAAKYRESAGILPAPLRKSI